MTHPFHPENGFPARRLMLVDMDDGSYRELAPSGGEQSLKNGVEQKFEQRLSRGSVPGASADGAARPARPDPVPAGFDPWTVAYDFPERWRAYLHANFRNHILVAQVFNVSEPTARKWWEGKGACHGNKTAIAMALHPVSALALLYGIAAE